MNQWRGLLLYACVVVLGFVIYDVVKENIQTWVVASMVFLSWTIGCYTKMNWIRGRN